MKLNDFKLERYFAEYEFAARYLLCCSDCESLSIQDLLDFDPENEADFKKLGLGYTESQGSPDLRREIAGLYATCTPRDILVHSGAEEAIFNFMNAVLEPGDHVIVQTPCYQSLMELPEAIGCEISCWDLMPAPDGWKADMDALQQAIQKNTRAIIINSPHNPTGHLFTRPELEQIVEMCRADNILLFADEVYRYLEYDEQDRLPWACDIYDNAVSLGVMSKSFGLAGLRIGWVAARNTAILEKMAAFKDYTSICNSAPSEFLAAIALRHRQPIIERNLKIIKQNLLDADKFFAKYCRLFAWYPPQAGPIAFPSLKSDGNMEEIARSLVRDQGVLVLPGNCYGMDKPFFRIGLGRSNFQTGLKELDLYLESKFIKI